MYKNNLIINESEKKDILSKHSKYRNILIKELNRTKGKNINEQTYEIDQAGASYGTQWIMGKNRKEVKDLCASNPAVQFGKYKQKPVLVLKRQDGTVSIFTNEKSDMGGWIKYNLKNENDSNPQEASWTCKKLYIQIEQEIQSYKDKDWKTAEELKEPDSVLYDTKRYQNIKVGTETLFKPVFGQEKFLEPEIQELIQGWESKGYKFNPSRLEISQGNWKPVSPAKFEEAGLPTGYKVYYNSDEARKSASLATDRAKKLQDITPEEATCRTSIKTYFDYYSTAEDDIDVLTFAEAKKQAIACAKNFSNKWSKGGFLGAKTGETKNLLDIINLLTSSKLDVKDVDGHQKPDRGSKWYLDNKIGL